MPKTLCNLSITSRAFWKHSPSKLRRGELGVSCPSSWWNNSSPKDWYRIHRPQQALIITNRGRLQRINPAVSIRLTSMCRGGHAFNTWSYACFVSSEYFLIHICIIVILYDLLVVCYNTYCPIKIGYNINLLIIGQQISENPLEVIVAAIYIVCALNINNNLSNLLECITVLYNAA